MSRLRDRSGRCSLRFDHGRGAAARLHRERSRRHPTPPGVLASYLVTTADIRTRTVVGAVLVRLVDDDGDIDLRRVKKGVYEIPGSDFMVRSKDSAAP